MHKKLIADFHKLAKDEDRWKWVIENQDKGITVICDNDGTYVVFDHQEDQELMQFRDFIGWADGIFALLEAVGIKCQAVYLICNYSFPERN